MTYIIGIDFSGAKSDRNTWAAIGELTADGRLEFLSAQITPRSDVAELLAAAPTPAVAAIDFPFGTPVEFASFLDNGSIESMRDVWRTVFDMSLDDFISARNEFVHRFGELKRAGDEKHFSESFSPLHKVNPNMLPMTYYGIKMLHELHLKQSSRWVVPPMNPQSEESRETVTLLETMPGAFLRAIGTIYKGYKNPKSIVKRAERRSIILDALEHQSGVFLANLCEVRADCIANDDCLDAVVAATAAAVWAQAPARFRHPSTDEMTKAKLEGWIYAPQSDA